MYLRIDHVNMLERMSGLRSLRLILHGARLNEWRLPVAQHKVHSLCATAFPRLSVLVVLLLSYASEYRTHSSELRLSEIEAETWPSCFNPQPDMWEPPDLTDLLPAAKRTMHQLRERKVEVSEAFYDHHRYYPVRANEDCANRELCEHMRKDTIVRTPAANKRYRCAGTKDMVNMYGCMI